MRILTITLLLLVAALPAAADHDARFVPGRSGRDLLVQARRLDDAASRLFRDVYALNGRSPLTRDSREVAEAAHEFRRQVERGAAWSRLGASYQRVGHRYHQLGRRLQSRHWREPERHYDRYDRHPRQHGHDLRRPIARALGDFERAYRAAGSSLERYAYAGRDRRWQDWPAYGPFGDRRHDDWRRDRYRRVPGRED